MLREVAEYPNCFGPLGRGPSDRDPALYARRGGGRGLEHLQRQRFPLEELDEVLEEVRAHLRERGRTRTQWEVGSSAPDDLVDALLARGVRPDKDPYAVALVLTSEPPDMRPGLSARRVETLEELEAACAVQWEAFGSTPAEIAEAKTLLPTLFRESENLRHAVWLDGEIVCTGTSSPTEHGLLLYGGATSGTRARPRRLPSADPGALGRRGRPRHPGTGHAGWFDVTPDPGTPRLRAHRRGAHADGRLRLAGPSEVRQRDGQRTGSNRLKSLPWKRLSSPR